MRKPLGKIQIDIMRTIVFIDSCAFDPKYAPENTASNELFEWFEKSNGVLIIAHSTKKELEHPNTPSWVVKMANSRIYSKDVYLTPDELKDKNNILRILAGGGKIGNMISDATHIFEAYKYGATYFITTDKGILKRKDEIINIYNLRIVKPSEMLSICKSYMGSY